MFGTFVKQSPQPALLVSLQKSWGRAVEELLSLTVIEAFYLFKTLVSAGCMQASRFLHCFPPVSVLWALHPRRMAVVGASLSACQVKRRVSTKVTSDGCKPAPFSTTEMVTGVYLLCVCILIIQFNCLPSVQSVIPLSVPPVLSSFLRPPRHNVYRRTAVS